MTESVSVIVSGAGPAGLVVALRLAQAGIPVTVLELEKSLPQDLRATTFHPPTMDYLDSFGIVPTLKNRGNWSAHWQFRDRKLGKIAEFDLNTIADHTRHPYRLQCEQFYLTEELLKLLEASPNAEIVFGAKVEVIEQTSAGVNVEFEREGTRHRRKARFLIAADGARSFIRKTLPVTFDGFTYEERLIQTGTSFDFRAHMPGGIADINYISDAEEWCVLLLIAGYWRVSFPIGPEESEQHALSEQEFQRRLRNLFDCGKPYDLTHRKCWRIHQRVASTFRHGNILLVGDAAHINSPHGGMGMNSAIHDAFNLTDKLIGIAHGGRLESDLDQYVRQRRFVALEDVRQQSMRNAKLMNERDPKKRLEALDDMRRMADDPAAARSFLVKSSMIEGLMQASAVQ